MNQNANIWPSFLQQKLDSLRSLPIINQCAHDWRNRSAINVCEVGLTGFFMFKFLAPELHNNINWTLYYRKESDIESWTEGLIDWCSECDMQLQNNIDHKSYTFKNKINRWHIELRAYQNIDFFRTQDLSRFNLFALSFGLSDLPVSTLHDFFQTCYQYNMAVFLGPLYDGTLRWIPESDGDGHMIDQFHASMLNENTTDKEQPGGVNAARMASTMLSQQSFTVLESEHILSACQHQNSFLRSLIQNIKMDDGSSANSVADRWSSSKFYMLAANKLKARIGFRLTYAKSVK